MASRPDSAHEVEALRNPVLLLLVVLVPAAAPPIRGEGAPANDDFEDAHSVALPTTLTADLLAATMQPGEPSCGSASGSAWFRFTAPERVLLFDVHGWDVAAAVYEGSSFSDLRLVECDGYGGRLLVEPGRTYYVQLTNRGTHPTLSVDLSATRRAPNDAFANATPIDAFPFDGTAELAGAFGEPGEPNVCAPWTNAKASVWYAFTPERDTLLAFSYDDAVIAGLYEGTSLGALTSVACMVAFDEDPDGLYPVRVRAGVSYHLQVAWYWAILDPESVRVSIAQPPRPHNDDIANAMRVDALPFNDALPTTLGATLEEGEPQPPDLALRERIALMGIGGRAEREACSPVEATVWYRLAPSDSVLVEAQTPDGYYWWNAAIAVYERDDEGRLALVACNDNAPGDTPCLLVCEPGGDPYDPGSRVAFLKLEGHEYLVQVGGVEGATGPLEIAFSAVTPGLPIVASGLAVETGGHDPDSCDGGAGPLGGCSPCEGQRAIVLRVAYDPRDRSADVGRTHSCFADVAFPPGSCDVEGSTGELVCRHAKGWSRNLWCCGEKRWEHDLALRPDGDVTLVSRVIVRWDADLCGCEEEGQRVASGRLALAFGWWS